VDHDVATILFTDGAWRPVYEQPDGRQYVDVDGAPVVGPAAKRTGRCKGGLYEGGTRDPFIARCRDMCRPARRGASSSAWWTCWRRWPRWFGLNSYDIRFRCPLFRHASIRTHSRGV
jgi:hypothetical protein